MPRERQDFLSRAEINGGGEIHESVNGDTILDRLSPKSEQRHKEKLEQWDLFVTKKRPGGDAHDLESLKHFVLLLGQSIKGTGGLPGCVETLRQYWNLFTGAWRRKYNEIPSCIRRSVTNYIYQVVQPLLGLLDEKRPRRYPGNSFLLIYAKQMWMNDWHVFQRPGIRVSDWSLLLSNIYTTARIGEYVESSNRKGSGRGLTYNDLQCICFWNEDHDPELAIMLTKDAKNYTNMAKSKRPKASLAEGRTPDLLCFNPLLPTLAQLLKQKAFRNYNNMEEVFAVKPPEHVASCNLDWKDELLDTPFWLHQSTTEDDRIESAPAVHNRNMRLGVRSGMPSPPTQHDWRARQMLETDKHYSESARMKSAGHINPSTFRNYYEGADSGVDGKAVLRRTERRDIVAAAFHDAGIPYNPNLPQRLPAKEEYEFEKSHSHLTKDKATLKAARLKEIQVKHPYNPDDPPGIDQSIFGRVSFMMPERKRLATNLFKEATLRSDIGKEALRDMITLLNQTSEVEFRPGLEPEKCTCSMSGGEYDWRHIYNCYKQQSCNERGFAELCFQCNEWVLGKQEWSDHCLTHLRDPDSWPFQSDPLLHGGVLATPGSCPICRTSERLPPHERMYQYLNRATWEDHMHKHIRNMRQKEREHGTQTLPCVYSACLLSFECVLNLEFHLQDVHGVPMIKEPKAESNPTGKDPKVKVMSPRPRASKRTLPKDKHEVKKERLESYPFINNTPITMRTNSWRKLQPSSTHNTIKPEHELAKIQETSHRSTPSSDVTRIGSGSSGYDNPLSSTCSDGGINRDTSLRTSIEAIDLTDTDGTLEQPTPKNHKRGRHSEDREGSESRQALKKLRRADILDLTEEDDSSNGVFVLEKGEDDAAQSHFVKVATVQAEEGPRPDDEEHALAETSHTAPRRRARKKQAYGEPIICEGRKVRPGDYIIVSCEEQDGADAGGLPNIARVEGIREDGRLNVMWTYHPSHLDVLLAREELGAREILFSDHKDVIYGESLREFVKVQENHEDCRTATDWYWNKLYQVRKKKISPYNQPVERIR